MKLNTVSARTGIQWVKFGIRTFFKQPLALAGLFFMFIASMSVLSMVPLIGSLLALALFPAATLGLMAATKEATLGKFPMPAQLITAFRAGPKQTQSMLVLGAIYALGFLVVMGVSSLFDGGKFAQLYLLGGSMTKDTLMQTDVQSAMWVSLILYFPLSMLFWHAPALVHWHGVSPVKSLFFSFTACIRNFGSFAVFGLAWMGAFLAIGMVVTMVATLAGGVNAAGAVMVPAALLMSAMFFTSIFFTFESNFDSTAEPAPEAPTGDKL